MRNNFEQEQKKKKLVLMLMLDCKKGWLSDWGRRLGGATPILLDSPPDQRRTCFYVNRQLQLCRGPANQ